MLLAHGDSGSPSMTLVTGSQNQLGRFSFNAANEYARTQDFWGNGTRSTIIDTYA
jgi:hypothetical protein